jgi:nicotinamidase-related amidase
LAAEQADRDDRGMNRALVVIDVQESFRQRPIWAASSAPDIAERVARLVAASRAAGDLVVWVLHTEPGTGGVFDPTLGYVRLMDGLAPLDDEPTLTKTSHNAFTTTNLQQVLTLHGVRHVMVSGIRTEQCCETTARVASDLGYDVTFVIDATATNPIENPDAAPGRSLDEILADPSTLPVDQIIERTRYALSGRFAAVRTIEDVVGEVAAGVAG